MKKILASVLSSCLLASALSAVSFKEDSLKVSFEGYKTKRNSGSGISGPGLSLAVNKQGKESSLFRLCRV